MAKKKKSSKEPKITKEVKAPEEKKVEVKKEPEPKKEPPKAPPPPPPGKMFLADAARRFAKGFKEFWLPGIMSFAKSQGFQEPATEEECKKLLKQWGARF